MSSARQRRSAHLTWRLALLLVVMPGALSLGACGRLNRTATIGSAATGPAVAGAVLATAVQRELAARGAPSAGVTCAHKVLVRIGTTSTCSYTHAGRTEVVTFRFADSKGAVVSGSVATH